MTVLWYVLLGAAFGASVGWYCFVDNKRQRKASEENLKDLLRKIEEEKEENNEE